MSNEADTCRMYVLPKLREAGWDDDQIREQVSFTDGRIVVVGKRTNRRAQKRAAIPIKLPQIDKQVYIVAYLYNLQTQVNELCHLHTEIQRELEALLPAVLDRAFRGEL